ncbi:peptide chain release factor N(5)-glutamine methyltransferase [Mycoplasma simbae]|uniref:peptide chain release factor N(5)-glutamine methyltransferase n=1 Tax=Mycoplasma simbae TaxID=36744 RepID=UPI000495A430|nr:peptide chain release factor N(5)-glutamine methyltransferase [Mycoplasma simbae]
MPTVEELIQEKRRYGLDLTVSEDELNKLKQGMPIQYIMGYVEFLNTRINLNHKVLIPRYETEEMVDLILNKYAQNNTNFSVLDLCCGSGFIGLALKKNMPNIQVTLSDIDPEALQQTRENALINFGNADVVKIIQSDLFANIDQKFDLIVTNPPYLDEDILLPNDKDLMFEPQHALYASEQGWYFYRKILEQYKDFLKPGGKIIFEINPLHFEKWNEVEGATILEDINRKKRFVIV